MKFTKRGITIYFLIFALIFVSNMVSAGWFNFAWTYQQAITINNSNPNNLTNYQMNISLNSTNFNFSAAQTQGQDLRFTDTDGITPLNYYIESYNSTSQNAIVWVNINISALSNKTIYLYYGNPLATTASSSYATFIFYNNFSDYSPYDRIRVAVNAGITQSHANFSDGTDYWKAAPQYQNSFIADTWYAFSSYPNYFTASQVQNTYLKFINARDGNGNFPISLNSTAGAANYYSGLDNMQNHTTGDPIWFLPMMMQLYYNKTGNTSGFAGNLSLIKAAMATVPRNSSSTLISSGNSTYKWIPWGFHDGAQMTGDDLMGSLLYYEASIAMANLYTAINDNANATYFTNQANGVKNNISELWNSSYGMFNAASGQNNQVDILGSAYAIYLNITNSTQTIAISNYLVSNYSNLTYNGFVRQSPQNWPYHWGTSGPGDYDDGYWSVGHYWIALAIQKTNPTLAIQFINNFSLSTDLLKEYYGNTTNGFDGNLESPMGAFRFMNENIASFPSNVSTNYTLLTSGSVGGGIGFTNNSLILSGMGVMSTNILLSPTIQPSQSNYTVEMNASIGVVNSSLTDFLIGILGFQNSIASTNTGYVAQYGNISSSSRVDIENFTIAHLINSSISFVQGTFYSIKGIFSPKNITAIFQGSTSVNSSDSYYTSGYYGIRSYNANSNISLIKISSYALPAPSMNFTLNPAKYTPPIVSLNSPINSYSSSSSTVTFNGSAVAGIAQLSNVSLILNGAISQTNTSGINNTNYLFSSALTNGNYNWAYQVCDTAGNCINSSTYILIINVPSSNPSGSTSSLSGSTSITTGNSTVYSFSTTSGIPLTINISSNVIPISQIVITTIQAISASITILQIPLISNSQQLQAANGSSYQSFQIIPTGITDSNISNVLIKFKVDASWISNNNLNLSNVALYRNSGNWMPLPTSLVSNDSQYYYFIAISPGFSNYTIFATNTNQTTNISNNTSLTNQTSIVNSLNNLFTNIKNFISDIPNIIKFTTGSIFYYILFVVIVIGIIITIHFVLKYNSKKLPRRIWKKDSQ